MCAFGIVVAGISAVFAMIDGIAIKAVTFVSTVALTRVITRTFRGTGGVVVTGMRSISTVVNGFATLTITGET